MALCRLCSRGGAWARWYDSRMRRGGLFLKYAVPLVVLSSGAVIVSGNRFAVEVRDLLPRPDDMR